ncbi:MAG: DegV family protein [Bacilli bacterium]|nr:DegV family protein [Bacilli bacterium]
MKIAISAESTIDLSKELLQEFDIHVIPFTIMFGEEVKNDDQVTNQQLFDYVKQTKQLPKTSAVNQFQYEEYFEKLLTNYEAVIHFSLSGDMSSTYHNALIAAKKFEGKVIVVDSRSLSTGIALSAIYARGLARQNLSLEEIVKKVKERIPHVQASFVIQSVDYLYKGGRCSKVAMLGANLFHICPQIIVKDGKMDAGQKFRGKYFDVVSQYVDETLKEFNHPNLDYVFITYPSLDDENNIVNMIKEKLYQKGFKRIMVTTAGSTVACHCGPNTIGILYFND